VKILLLSGGRSALRLFSAGHMSRMMKANLIARRFNGPSTEAVAYSQLFKTHKSSE